MSEAKPEDKVGGLFKHSTIYAIGNVASRVGSFLLLPLYTHYLSVEQYGALELFYVTSSVISSVLSVGLAHATLRFYYEYKEVSERNKVVTTCLITTALYAVPFLLLLSHWNEPLARLVFSDVGYASSFKIVYAILVIELLRQIGLAYFRAKEYSTLYVVVCLVQLVLQVGCNVYTVGFRKWGVTGVLWGNLLSIAAGFLFIMWYVTRECGFAYDVKKMKDLLKYSYPFIFTAVIGVVLRNLDRITLGAFFSLREVGLYSLALKFGSLLQELALEPYNRGFGAYRFKIMYDADVKETLVRVYHYLMVGLFFMGLGISLYSREVLRLMTDPTYWDAHSLIPLLALSFAVSGAGYTFQTGLLYEKQTKYMIHITLVSAIVNVLLYLALIPRFGMMGATGAVVGKAVLETVLTYWASHRFYPIHYELFKTMKIFAVSAALVGVGLLVPTHSLWVDLPLKTALLVSFPALLYATGCLESADITWLKGYVMPLLAKVRARAGRG